jgi:DNA-directed RNA polymerase specialized sigma24 family protein
VAGEREVSADMAEASVTDDLLRAIVALLADERDRRVQDDASARKTEVLLADAGLSYQLIAQLIGKQPDAVRKAISRAKQSRSSSR